MDQLIVKYLQGNLTLQEQHELSKWIQQDEKNAKVLHQMGAYWRNHKTDLADEEQEVRRILLERISREQMQEPHGHKWKYGYLLKVAAVLVVCMAMALVLSRMYTGQQTTPEIALVEKVSLPGQRITTQLPDGTVVKLNSNSTIIAPSRFSDGKREVTLIGEGFFEVTKDPSRPFIIKTEKMTVRVLGTSFNVSAYQDGSPQTVAVRTGKVEVQETEGDSRIELEPMEMTRYERDGGLLRSRVANADVTFGWVNQKMVFDNRSIEEVFEKISRWYGLEVTVHKKIKEDKKYTASFENPSLKEVMDILAFVYDFEYKIDEGKVIIQ